MARKRLLSPEVFKHAGLYDLEVTTGLPVFRAFQGLWCQADRRGLFAWRPVDLRLEIFPYGFGVHSTVLARCQHCASTVLGMADVMADTLDALCRAGMLEYYEVEGRGYGRIPSFHSWQTFHVAEKANRQIPEPLTAAPVTNSPPTYRHAAPCQHGASTVLAPVQHGASTPVTGTGTDTVTGTNYLPAADHAAPVPGRQANTAKPRATPRPAPAYPHFPVALCQRMYALWVSRMGACDFPRFRKALGPLFTLPEADRPPEAPRDAELEQALKAYADLAPIGAAARFTGINHAAGLLSAIAVTRRDHADNVEARTTALMRIIHGRSAA